MNSGVSQRSVLVVILFLLYTADLQEISAKHSLYDPICAPMTPACGSCRPEMPINLGICLLLHRRGCSADECQSPSIQHHQDLCDLVCYLSTSGLKFGDDVILYVKSVHSVDSFIESDHTVILSHVTKTVSRCFAALRQLRKVRRSVPSDDFRSLMASLILTRLD